MTAMRSTRSGPRVLLRVDAVFEVVLAVGCLWLAGRLPSAGGWALPPWIGRPVLAGLAVVLLVAAGALWWLSGRWDPGAVRVVAAANGTTAFLVAILAGVGAGCGVWLRVVLGVTAAVLAGLAIAQWQVRPGDRHG